jgi:hypothetical protein
MLNTIKKYLGYLWASPITVAGLVYVQLFTLAGWYKYSGKFGDSLVWQVNIMKSPIWLLKRWLSWAGHTVGNVVVMKHDPNVDVVTLTHESKHVNQMMRLGIFQPILYGLCYVGIKLGCPGSDPYFSNSFEIDARRAAKQVIDVEGIVKMQEERYGKK